MDESDRSAGAAAAATTGSSVAAGSVWHVTSRVVPQLYTLVVSIVAARYLGPDGMGRQSFIAFVELSLIMVLTGGPFVALMRYAGETVGRDRPEALHLLARWAWRLAALAAVIGAGVLIAAAATGSDPEAAWVLAGVACALGILHVVPSALLIGLQRWRDATIVGLVTGTIATVATVAVLAAGGGIVGMFAVEAAASAVILFFTVLLARRALGAVAGGAAPGPAPELLRGVWRFTAVTSLSVALAFVVARRSELFFLNHYASDAEIAVYSIVFASVTALVYIPDALASTVTPAFATLHGAGQADRITDGFGRTLRLLLIVVMPMTAATLALGPLGLRLAYGEEYEATGGVLLIMASLVLLAPPFALGIALIEGLGKLRVPLLAAGFGAAVDLGLAWLVVPGHGAIGAAVANVGGQVALGLPVLVYACRIVGRFRLELGALGRTAIVSALAGLAAAACTWALDGWLALVAGLAAGTLTLAALAVAFRVLPAGDGAWLEGLLSRRLRPLAGYVHAATAGPR